MTKPPLLQSRQVRLAEPHYEVHQGAAFVASHIFPGLASGSAASLLLLPSARHAHTVFDVSSGGDAEIYLFEAPTLDATGTALGLVNLNRALQSGANMLAYHTPTVTASGTALFEAVLPGASGMQLPPGLLPRANTEWLLKNDIAYLLFAINAGNTTEAISINMECYEEDLW